MDALRKPSSAYIERRQIIIMNVPSNDYVNRREFVDDVARSIEDGFNVPCKVIITPYDLQVLK